MSDSTLERIWTIHEEDAWEAFQEQGVIKGDGRRIIHDHRKAYRWMMRQMKDRIPGYGGGYPVWAYSRWAPDEPKPDVNDCVDPSPKRLVMLECEVPRDRILKSDVELWNFVLNGTEYLGRNEQEEEAWEARARSGKVHHATLAKEMRDSWMLMFELTNDRGDKDWLGDANSNAIQAAIEQITLDQVKKIEHFVIN